MKPLQRGHCIRVVLQLTTLDSWWSYGGNGSNESDHTVESIVFAESRPVVGEAMLKWSHNSTLYCTLSHFPTPFRPHHLRCRPLYAFRGSVNHTYWVKPSIFHCIRTLTQSPAAGPAYYKGLYQHCIRYWSSIHPHMRKPFTHYPSTACDDHHPIVL